MKPSEVMPEAIDPGEPGRARRRGLRLMAAGLLAGSVAAPLLLGGCASLPGMEPPRVSVVGVERVRAEALELRLAVKLRIQNVGSMPLSFDGLAIDLDVNGRRLASGVTAEPGNVPRFGELVVTVPVTVSATAAVRQMLGLLDGSAPRELPYVLRGRLSGGPLPGLAALGASVSFSAEGSLQLPR
jgi:hypothetical protein